MVAKRQVFAPTGPLLNAALYNRHGGLYLAASGQGAGMFYGIDFGTSNSTVAFADADRAWLIPLEGDHRTLPSAVFWEVDDPAPVFGRAAIAAYAGGEDGRLLRGLKSTLGSGLIHEKTRIGRRAVSFRDILGRFFLHLRDRMDRAGGTAGAVVLGRPVHFVDDDPAGDAAAEAVLAEIAAAAGFAEIAFQYEPIAAALHYEQSVTAEELVLIADIGGGTSDFSILRVSPDRARAADRTADILGNDGIRVGGTDFDRLLSLAEVMPTLGLGSGTGGGKGLMPRHYFFDLATWHRINTLYSGQTMSDLKALRAISDEPERIDRMIRVVSGHHGHALAMAVEVAKVALSDAMAARLDLHAFTGGPNPMVRRAVFEQAIAEQIGRITARVTGLLKQANITADQIGTVFMTGGSSSLPILHNTFGALLPAARIATGDLFGSVGTGLALDARRRFG